MQMLSNRLVAKRIAFILGVILSSGLPLTYGQSFVAKDFLNVEDVDIGTVFDLADARNTTIKSRHVLRGVFSTWLEQKVPLMRLSSRKKFIAERNSYRPKWDLYFNLYDGDSGMRFRIGDHGVRFSPRRGDTNELGQPDVYVGIRVIW